MSRASRCPAWLAPLVLFYALICTADALQVPTGTWAPTGAMSSAHTGATAALLVDGRVLVAGGP